MPAYGHGDEASAKRMFERDKDTLREAGIPVELEATDAWDVEKGYRIPHEAYYLPAIAFTQDELWALFVAAHTPGSDGEAEMAFQKLSSGADTDVLPILAAGEPTPGVDVSGPHLATVADALARRRALRFRYRPLHGRAGQRTVDPFALVFRSGSWYVVGNDRERKDVRSFRLSRVQSEMRDAGAGCRRPDGFDAASHLESGPWGIGKPAETARVGFTPRIAWLVVAQTPGASVAAHPPRRLGGDRGPGEPDRGVRLVGALVRPRRAGVRASDDPGPRRRPAGCAACERAPCLSGRRPPTQAAEEAVARHPRASIRLRRLLAAVPYIIRHPGVRVSEVAALFGMAERDLLQDLNLLFMSGLPPYGPGELIDVETDDEGRVWIRMADYFARPLRLTTSEALSLYLRGKALMGTPGLHETGALASALDKIEASLGPEALSRLIERVDTATGVGLRGCSTCSARRRRATGRSGSSTSRRRGTR